MDKNKKRWVIAFGVVMLIGIILLAIFLGWFSKRGKAFNSRPLVLIHSPIHNDQYQVGGGILVHTTAREDQGLDRIELWANGKMIDEVVAEDLAPTNLVLNTSWVPTFVGHHLLVVRAVSVDGVQGQSSVSIFAGEAEPDGTGIHTVEEGETLESIEEDFGTSPDDLSELNPDLAPGGLAPGDDLVVPDDEPSPGEVSELPGGDREVPLPEGEAPLFGFMSDVYGIFTPPAEEALLRVEVPRLRTGESYDGLHCYLSLAGSVPLWYPDNDYDQATDESFESLDGGWWNTETTLVGTTAPFIPWPGDQPFPFTVSCVGIAGGGTEAVELGQVDLEIPPEDWNGIQQTHETSGEGGQLFFATRVTRVEGLPGYAPKYPDPDMTSPTNVRLNDARRTIEWDYEPIGDEDIDGFRIYLNGSMQWTEPADARESRLPHEWFNPPCASTYAFEVTAFQLVFPDGPESLPGSVDLTQPREGCTRQVQVTFLTLETLDLGGDGNHEDRHGDVGPAYGSFFANESIIEFDGGREGPGLDMPSGLRHNWTYNIGDMAGDPGWRFSSPNSAIVDIPNGGTLNIGYGIMDRDTGRCDDSGDRGCDDPICDGAAFPIRDDSYGYLDAIHRETITSEDGRCRVTVEYRPAFDSPVGSRGPGGEPLPWIGLTDFSVEERTGAVTLEVINGGTAFWPEKDLIIELQTRDGSILGNYAWPDYVLRPGETDTLQNPQMVLNPPYDACVVIDPFDDVLELFERTGAMYHTPICPQMPDLTITRVYYDTRIGNRLRVFVQNIGDEAIVNRTVTLELSLPDGTLLVDPILYPGVSLTPGETHIMEIPGLADVVREQMRSGYQVTINPDERIVEQFYDNNSYTIGEATRLWIYWKYIEVPYDVRDTVEFELDANVISGEQREQVANWNIRQDIDWGGSCFRPRYCMLHFDDGEYETYWFDIYGDQALEIQIDVIHPGTLRRSYSITEIFRGPTWGGAEHFNYGCGYFSEVDGGQHHWVFDYIGENAWKTRINICRENARE